MADYGPVTAAKHATFTPDTEDRISFVGLTNGDPIEVTNRSGTGEIFYTTDGTTATVAGDDTKVLVAAVGASRVHAVNVVGDAAEFRIHLISHVATDYTVTRLTS